MLVVVASVSGAPGASTAALGMAALWPERPALLVEADPGGGVVAARFGLAQEPGLASLAAAARHGGHAGGAVPYVQQVPLGLHVLVGPGAAETAAGAVSVLAGQADAVAGLAPAVVADVGRLYANSPAWGLLRSADAVVLVTSGSTEYLDHLDTRLPALRAAARSGGVGLAVCGRSAYTPAEISGRLGVPVWAQLPTDRWGAGVLAGRMTGRAWTRTRLAQALRALAASLAAGGRPAGAALEVVR
ncbi:MinD/ParA family protein [Micromonospora mangrovi]|uniref:MinD-like ATPase involved in chromosome partitioning or flagellar assembly n=2 Tax=Micromonospora TaxID=1873 RepID=A0AAU7MH40_9ACTN